MTARDGKPCKKCGGNEWRLPPRSGCLICHREYNRKWIETNMDKVRETNRRWHSTHRDKVYEQQRQWRSSNPDMVNAKTHRRRTRVKGGGGSYTAEQWKTLCEQYDYRCLRCGRDDVKLTVDHVLPITMGGSSNIDNLQPLCKPCNSWKANRHIDFRTKPGLLSWLQSKLF